MINDQWNDGNALSPVRTDKCKYPLASPLSFFPSLFFLLPFANTTTYRDNNSTNLTRSKLRPLPIATTTARRHPRPRIQPQQPRVPLFHLIKARQMSSFVVIYIKSFDHAINVPILGLSSNVAAKAAFPFLCMIKT